MAERTDMDPRPACHGLSAPAATPATPLRFPAHESTVRSYPPLDERLVRPETYEEMIRGQRVLATPCDEEHGDPHCDFTYLIAAHLRPAYRGSIDLLTRHSESSDFAADITIRLRGRNDRTGDRHLEELAFEVMNTQTAAKLKEKAEDMTARGVRRVFAIDVNKGEVLEWTPREKKWETLPRNGTVVDERCLTQPLPLQVLLDLAREAVSGASRPDLAEAADNAVASALAGKGNPFMAKREAQAEARGAILELCDMLGIELSEDRLRQLRQLDLDGLRQLRASLKSRRAWPS